jgi:hypothetical protein
MRLERTPSVVTSATFHAAADLLEQPGGWCRHAFGRDARGRRLPGVEIGSAVSFCSEGALMRVMGVSYDHPAYKQALGVLEAVTGVADLPRWNDSLARQQAQVVALFRRAAQHLAEAG